jgi:hypothetical protein
VNTKKRQFHLHIVMLLKVFSLDTKQNYITFLSYTIEITQQNYVTTCLRMENWGEEEKLSLFHVKKKKQKWRPSTNK